MNPRREPPTEKQRVLIDACVELGVPFWWRTPGTLLIHPAGLVDVMLHVVARGERVGRVEPFEVEPMIGARLDIYEDPGIDPEEIQDFFATWPEGCWGHIQLVRHRSR